MPKKNMRNAGDRAAILARLHSLTPASKPTWGSLTAPKLLCHLADGMRVSLGDLHAEPRGSALRQTMMRWLIVNSSLRPPPGKAKTIPEMLTASPGAWETDLAMCVRLIERVAVTESGTQHPIFGRLSAQGIGRLAWRHFDYHLRQFGV